MDKFKRLVSDLFKKYGQDLLIEVKYSTIRDTYTISDLSNGSLTKAIEDKSQDKTFNFIVWGMGLNKDFELIVEYKNDTFIYPKGFSLGKKYKITKEMSYNMITSFDNCIKKYPHLVVKDLDNRDITNNIVIVINSKTKEVNVIPKSALTEEVKNKLTVIYDVELNKIISKRMNKLPKKFISEMVYEYLNK